MQLSYHKVSKERILDDGKTYTTVQHRLDNIDALCLRNLCLVDGLGAFCLGDLNGRHNAPLDRPNRALPMMKESPSVHAQEDAEVWRGS